MRLIVTVLIAVLAVTARPEVTLAQGCGIDCGQCTLGHSTREGEGDFEDCPFCHFGESNNCCFSECCECGSESLGANAPVDAAIAGSLEALPVEEAASFVEEHGDRILLDADRGFAVVLGGCTLNAPTMIVYMSAEVLGELRALGTRTMGEFIAESSSTPEADGISATSGEGFPAKLVAWLSGAVHTARTLLDPKVPSGE